jgi:hypothetical protein
LGIAALAGVRAAARGQNPPADTAVASASLDTTPRVGIVLSSFRGGEDHDGTKLEGLRNPALPSASLNEGQIDEMVVKAIGCGDTRGGGLPKIVTPEDWVVIKPQINESYPCVPSNAMSVRATVPGALSFLTPFIFTLKDTTTDGVYPITFDCTYQYNETDTNLPMSGSQSFTIYFSVTGKKAPSSERTPAPQVPSTMPRLMLTGYTVTPEVVMAGGEMTLDITISNMSSKQAAHNIKLTLTSGDATFLPKDGTNTAFISKLSAGKETTKTFTFNVKPDAAAAPSAISVEIVYNDASGNPGTETASISIPVNQPIRIKIDEPQVYGSGVSQPFSISMNI